MIRWSTTGDQGRKTVGLGLEAGNIDRLLDGKPIFVRGETVGIDFDIFIHYGVTKAMLIEQLREAGMELPEDFKS